MARSILIFSLLSVLVSAASATDHIVGAHLGWNPNINYTLWSNNQTFYVNDLICKQSIPSSLSSRICIKTLRAHKP